MKMENGATFGEFAVLRALKAKGGEAPFSELAKIELRGIALILGRMLSPRSRQKGVSGRQAGPCSSPLRRTGGSFSPDQVWVEGC